MYVKWTDSVSIAQTPLQGLMYLKQAIYVHNNVYIEEKLQPTGEIDD